MTAEDRRRVREARDAAVRATVLEPNRRLVGVLYCSGCGMELDDWTPGCPQCCDRWHGYKRRGTVPEWRYREKAQAGKDWGIFLWGRSNEENPRRGVKPAQTWAENRAALGVKNGGRLVRTPRGLI